MEKRRTKYCRAFTRVMLLALLFGAQTVQAQKLHRIKGYCGLFYSTMDDLYRQKEAELAFYQFLNIRYALQ